MWLIDFVGWPPMPDGGEREAFVAADYNAEMIEHIARFPRVRDQAIFVGNPADIVPDTFGLHLPLIGDWTREHYTFAGYVTGFDPPDLADRIDVLRQELGYRDDEQVCIVTVGGLRRRRAFATAVIEAFLEAKRRSRRCGWWSSRARDRPGHPFPSTRAFEVRAYVHQLYRHLAARDSSRSCRGLTTPWS